MNESKSSYENIVLSNSLNPERYDKILSWAKSNVQRRQQELENDLQQHVMLENKIISGQLSSIPGMQRHLSHAKLAKAVYESQEVADAQSHATFTRKELNRKFHNHKR